MVCLLSKWWVRKNIFPISYILKKVLRCRKRQNARFLSDGLNLRDSIVHFDNVPQAKHEYQNILAAEVLKKKSPFKSFDRLPLDFLDWHSSSISLTRFNWIWGIKTAIRKVGRNGCDLLPLWCHPTLIGGDIGAVAGPQVLRVLAGGGGRLACRLLSRYDHDQTHKHHNNWGGN